MSKSNRRSSCTTLIVLPAALMANDEETFMVDTEKARKIIVKKRSKCEMGKNAALARAFIQERFLRHLRALHHAKFAWGSLWNLIAIGFPKSGETQRERGREGTKTRTALSMPLINWGKFFAIANICLLPVAIISGVRFENGELCI